MKKKKINIGILAHVDAGKTTITEQLLSKSGAIRRAGSVDQGTTQTDWMDVERRRGISVKNACVEAEFEDVILQIVDTPGHVDFAGEVSRSLQVLDGAVLVISAVEGVQAQTITIFRALQRMKIPTLLVVNKVDRAGFEEERILEQIKTKLKATTIALEEVTDPGQQSCRILSAPDLLTFAETRKKEYLLETLAEVDEEMEEAYLLEEMPPVEALVKAMQTHTHRGELSPLLYCCAKEGKGIEELIFAIKELLPDASYREVQELQGLVFAVTHDPLMGKAAYIRLFGGSLSARDELPILPRKREKAVSNPLLSVQTQKKEPEVQAEKISQIRKIQGGKYQDTGYMEAGEIAAIYGISGIQVGDRIGRSENTHCIPDNAMQTKPLLLVRVEPESKEHEIRLAAALTELSEEDPLLEYERNPMTGEMYLRVMGAIQIEILEEVLEGRFGLKTSFSKPGVIYKEKPAAAAIGREVYTMPKPCWALVDLQVEPLPAGSGIQFESVIKEKELPYRYQNHVRQSVFDVVKQGIFGWEVVDTKITLVGGQHHHVHTHPLDFFVATPVALLRALTAGNSQLQEPYMAVRMTADESLLGKVMGQVLSMRGTTRQTMMEDGQFTMEAVIPLRDCMEYPITFRSMTSGKGEIFMELEGYHPCPKGFEERFPRQGVDPLDHAKWILSCRSAY